MEKQDRHGPRTPAQLEQKYGFSRRFAQLDALRQALAALEARVEALENAQHATQ